MPFGKDRVAPFVHNVTHKVKGFKLGPKHQNQNHNIVGNVEPLFRIGYQPELFGPNSEVALVPFPLRSGMPDAWQRGDGMPLLQGIGLALRKRTRCYSSLPRARSLKSSLRRNAQIAV